MDKNLYTLEKIKKCLNDNDKKDSIHTYIEDGKLYIDRFEGEVYDDFVTIATVYIKGDNVVDGNIVIDLGEYQTTFCMEDSFVDELENNTEYDTDDIVDSKKYGMVYVPIERITYCILDYIQFIYNETITVQNRHLNAIAPIMKETKGY